MLTSLGRNVGRRLFVKSSPGGFRAYSTFLTYYNQKVEHKWLLLHLGLFVSGAIGGFSYHYMNDPDMHRSEEAAEATSGGWKHEISEEARAKSFDELLVAEAKNARREKLLGRQWPNGEKHLG